MNKNLITKISSILVIIGVSVFLIASKNSSVASPGVKAQVSGKTNYTTNWVATDVLTIDSVGAAGEAAIGIAKWKVTGQLGEDKFVENWFVPKNLPAFELTEHQNSVGTTVVSGVTEIDQTVCSSDPDANPCTLNWLTGVVATAGFGSFEFDQANAGGTGAKRLATKIKKPYSTEGENIGVNNTLGVVNFPSTWWLGGTARNVNINVGIGTSCGRLGDPANYMYNKTFTYSCLNAMGAYGFDLSKFFVKTQSGYNGTGTYNYQDSDAWIDSRMRGVAIPLRWSVSGTFCPAGTTGCD